MRALVVVLVASLVATTGSIGTSAGATAAPARVIDRTFTCTTGAQAGNRELDVDVKAGFRETPGKWKYRPHAFVSTPGLSRGAEQSSIAGMTAGFPPADEFDRDTTLWVGARRCTTARDPVPFSTAGLAGGAAGALGERYECSPTKRILVRVRAVFRAPTSLRLHQGFNQLLARGEILEGSLAVRLQTGKPLLFAQVFQSGKARLFTSGHCVDE
jgi:hypothetical protein